MAKIKEIFTSIQGEGPFVGYKQVFVRFCKCNLNCSYCDTDFSYNLATEYSAKELANIINTHTDCHSVSLTGGEPLTEYSFLEELLPLVDLPVYLETNTTLYKNLDSIIKFVDFVSADIKLPSTTKLSPMWDCHDKFFKIASQKVLFTKVVFDKNITEDEIKLTSELAKKYNIELILQPKMNANNISVPSEFIIDTLNEFLKYHSKCRVIPQTHKFLNVI